VTTRKELEAAADLSQQVGTLYQKVFSLVAQHTCGNIDETTKVAIERELAGLLEPARILNEKADATCRTFGIIYSKLRESRCSFRFEPVDDFFVQWAAEECYKAAEVANNRQSNRDQLTHFWGNCVFRRIEQRCIRAAAIADDLAARQEDYEEQPDGPVEPSTWQQDGNIVAGSMNRLAWKMVHYLWHLDKFKSCELTDLAEPVYGHCDYDVSGDAIPSLRKKANSFFRENEIPWVVSVREMIVELAPSPKKTQRARGSLR
jgi:hypothetical protein